MAKASGKKEQKTSSAKQAKLDKIKQQEKRKKKKIIAGIVIVFLLALGFLVAAIVYNVKSGKEEENGITVSGTERGYDNDVVLGEYKGITYTKTEFEVTDADVDKYISDILDASPNYKIDYSRDNTEVKADDSVKLIYSVKMNDITYEEDVELIYTLGSGVLGEGVDERLIGTLVGGAVEINTALPEDYEKTSVAGKEVVLNVGIDSVVDVTEELTDDYCSTISGGTYTTVAEYRDYVYETLYTQKESAANEEDWNAIWDKLVSNCEISIDDAAASDAYDDMIDYYQSYADYMNVTLTELVTTAYGYGTLQDFYDYCRDYSENVVIEQTIYDAIIEKEGIAIDDATYNEKVTQYMEEAGYSSQTDFESLMGIDDIKQMMAYDAVTDLILSSAVAE